MLSSDFEWDLARAEQAVDFPEVYDVRKAKRIIVERPRPVEFLEMQRYAERFRAFLEGVRLRHNVNWEMIDTGIPLILGQSEGVKISIDGRHRMQRALDIKLTSVPAVILTEEETDSVRIVPGPMSDPR